MVLFKIWQTNNLALLKLEKKMLSGHYHAFYETLVLPIFLDMFEHLIINPKTISFLQIIKRACPEWDTIGWKSEAIEMKFQTDKTSQPKEFWLNLCKELRTHRSIDVDLMQKTVAWYCVHPRLDNNVTANISHLIKFPFGVHAETNRIAVPIKFSNISMFDPNTVPLVNDPITSYLFEQLQSPRKKRYCCSICIEKRKTNQLLDALRQNDEPMIIEQLKTLLLDVHFETITELKKHRKTFHNFPIGTIQLDETKLMDVLVEQLVRPYIDDKKPILMVDWPIMSELEYFIEKALQS
jgi:hypothetical protein